MTPDANCEKKRDELNRHEQDKIGQAFAESDRARRTSQTGMRACHFRNCARTANGPILQMNDDPPSRVLSQNSGTRCPFRLQRHY